MFEYDELQAAIDRQRRASTMVVVFVTCALALVTAVLVACETTGDMTEAEARAVVGVLSAPQE